MKVHYHNIPTRNGDCHFIVLQDLKEQYVIMVDCGEFNTKVKQYVENACKKHIDILVFTHIDAVHISGVIKMLDKYKDDDDFQVENILFNSYQSSGTTTETKRLTDE